jgi:hypothetical protein
MCIECFHATSLMLGSTYIISQKTKATEKQTKKVLATYFGV